MRACRPSWCASGHRQPVRRTMNGAPSAVWSSTWPHGVGRRSMGSSISSISFAAASKRPRRSCQRSSTRSDQDRPTPPPVGPLPGSGPTGGMQVYESIWTWLGHAAGMAVPAWLGPAHLLGKWVLQPGRSVRDPFGLAMAEQAGLDRAAIAWRSASADVLINEGRRLRSCLVGPDPSLLSRPLNEPWWSAAARGGGRPRPVGRPANLEDRASGPRRGGQPRAARACGIRSRCRSLRDLNRYSTG
jgi:hypothetical protein